MEFIRLRLWKARELSSFFQRVIKDAQGGVWMGPILDQDPASGAHVPSAGTARTLPEDRTPFFHALSKYTPGKCAPSTGLSPRLRQRQCIRGGKIHGCYGSVAARIRSSSLQTISVSPPPHPNPTLVASGGLGQPTGV